MSATIAFSSFGQTTSRAPELPVVNISSFVYVNYAAIGANNGTTWTDAYTSLTAAIAAAPAGAQVWIAQGTYTPLPAMDPAATFVLRNNIGLYGGFAGNEATLAERGDDLSAHPTILSGQLSPTLRCYHVLYGDGVGATTALDRLTITRGNASMLQGPAENHRGGGIYLRASLPIFRDCKIVDNEAGAYGGGVFIGFGSAPAFSNCTFRANLVSYLYSIMGGGGGVCVESSSAVFDRCAFTNNAGSNAVESGCAGGSPYVFSARSGGGLYLSSATVTMTGCIIRNNTSGAGARTGNCAQNGAFGTDAGDGAGIYSLASTLTMDRCIVAGNTTGSGADATYSLRFCSAHGGRGGRGAGVFAGGETHLTNCVFIANSTGGGGAATFRQLYPECSPIASADGGDGAAIYATGELDVANCTFYGNATGFGGGGAIPGRRGSGGAIGGSVFNGEISNSIFWSNVDAAGMSQTTQVGHVTNVRHCDIQGLISLPNAGNFSADPRLANPEGNDGVLGTADDNLSLARGSPCIDSGDNRTYTGSLLDLAGNPRFIDDPATPDRGAGTAPIIDLGALEFHPHCAGDLDNGSGAGHPDGGVTIDDLLYFIAAYELGSRGADVDDGSGAGHPDGGVTIDDLIYYLARFDAGC